jgi:hypothetical protein
MARKSVGHVRLEWTCPHCDGLNPGPAVFCMSCGSPQPEDVQFHQPAEVHLIDDEGASAKAETTPDLHCPYCGVRNPGRAKFCQNCGGDLAEGTRRKSGRVVGAYSEAPAPPITCSNCGTENPASRRNCQACGASLARDELETAARPAPKAPLTGGQGERKKTPLIRVLMLGGLGAIACIGAAMFLFAMLKTEDLTGRVQAASWERSIGIEALVPVTESDWLSEIPSDVEVGSCEQRFHHQQDDPEAGAVEVCGTPYTIDEGTGYGEVVQDCYYEVYADYCEFTTDQWQEVDRVEISGSDLAPNWPTLSLAQGQREGDPRESYHVTFTTDDGTYDYTTTDSEEFSRYTPGSDWILLVNALGRVVSVEPAD